MMSSLSLNVMCNLYSMIMKSIIELQLRGWYDIIFMVAISIECQIRLVAVAHR
jgi:hypothetical protein